MLIMKFRDQNPDILFGLLCSVVSAGVSVAVEQLLLVLLLELLLPFLR